MQNRQRGRSGDDPRAETMTSSRKKMRPRRPPAAKMSAGPRSKQHAVPRKPPTATRSSQALFCFEVSERAIEADEIEILRNLLDEDVPVRSVVLVKNGLGDAGLEALPLKALANRVSRLVLRQQGLTDAGVEILVSALHAAGQECTVTEIDLVGNEALTARSGTSLGAWVLKQQRKAIVKLTDGSADLQLRSNLAWRGLESAEVGFLCQLVASNTRLTTLNLQGNRPGPVAWITLARALRFNCTIEQLNLKDCDVGPAVWQSLHRALTQNRSLLHVDLRHNRGLFASKKLVQRMVIDAQRLWPAFSRVAILFDDGSWLDGRWFPRESAAHRASLRTAKSPRRAPHRGGRLARPLASAQVLAPMRTRLRTASKIYGTDVRTDAGKRPSPPQASQAPTSQQARPEPPATIATVEVWTRIEEPATSAAGEVAESVVSFRRSSMRTRINPVQHIAATKIQCMVRRSFACARSSLIRRFATANRSKRLVKAVRVLQGFYRRVQQERLARVAECCIMVQKHFRRFMAQKRFAALSIALVRSASVKTLHTLRLGCIEVKSCGLEGCRGVYTLMGTGPDRGTAKYLREASSVDSADFLVERSRRIWLLRRIDHATGAVTTLYTNETITLFPPKREWSPVSDEPRAMLPAPTLSLRKRQVADDYDDDDEGELAFLEQQCRDRESLRLVDAGSPEVNGFYVAAGISNGVPLYMKRDAAGLYVYTIRRVPYLGEKRVWVVARQPANQETPDVASTRVFYVNKSEADQPPDMTSSVQDATWTRGMHGSLPLPLFVLQNASERRRQEKVITSQVSRASLSLAGAGVMRETTLDKRADHAARVVQRAFRAHMLLRIATASYTLKELSRIVAVTLGECGMSQAIGTYRCSRISEASATGSTTLSYTLERPGSDESFIIERIRKGTVWAVLRAKGSGGILDLIYVNKVNGHSLVPPKVGWKATNAKYVASPRVGWVMNDDDDGDSDDDEDASTAVKGSGLGRHVSKKELRHAHRVRDKYKQAMVVTDAGSLVVHGRFEQHGVADGVAAFQSNRDASIQLRRVVHGVTRLWVIVRILPNSAEPNIVYYYNTAHGQADSPPLDDWAAHKGCAPAPLVVAQQACIRPH